VKLALVTTPRSVRSGIGDYTRHLLPYLCEHCDVRLFVEGGELADDEEPVDALVPREHDRILYQLGNELRHAFMPRVVRALGGTVMLHDWVLFDMALKAFPALERGGLKGHVLALREGGPAQARVYARNWLDRRRQRVTPEPTLDYDELGGVVLGGWHEPEPDGRWTADHAVVRLPGKGCRDVRFTFAGEGDRTVELFAGTERIDRRSCRSDSEAAGDLGGADEPLVGIATRGIAVTREQRQHGDSRRLGVFVQRVEWRDAAGSHELDLSLPAAAPIAPVTLSRDRFALPLNRSVVRCADAFIVHSEYVKQRILRERNAFTPVGLLYHGAEKRWRDRDRAEVRRELGLDEAWVKSFLLVSFGGVQAHKRIDRVFAALAKARRQRDDIRLIMAGGVSSDGPDPRERARALGLAGAVHFTGYLAEAKAWDWIHAGDASVNLRGPTTGGTSGGIFQSLSLGRPVIASDAAEQSELPDSCIPKVPLGEGEVDALASLLVELRDQPERRAQLERAARRFVEDECHWSITARRYAEYLEAQPPHRSARKSLIALGLEAAARRERRARQAV